MQTLTGEREHIISFSIYSSSSPSKATAEQGSLSVPVAVVRTYQRRRSGRRHLCWLLYVCLHISAPLARVRRRYRRRFGIETGYRLMEQVRARTTSPDSKAQYQRFSIL